MSAILGLLPLDGAPVDRARLEAMGRLLDSCGGEGGGIWVGPGAGLGHRAWFLTPESRDERLPLDVHGAVLTADARLDNREALLSELGLDRSGPRPVTDAELIAAAYARWGEDCPRRLLGDFAFALWDPRRRRLFAARDPFGARPFYYHHVPGRCFAFASEMKALLPWASGRLSEVWMAEHLMMLGSDPAATVHRDLARLPPAHGMSVDAAGVRLGRYWSPGGEGAAPAGEDVPAAFLERLTEAVRCRMRSAYPVGCTMSGGLDSPAVAAVAQRLAAREGRSLHTFSAVFPEVPESDERALISSLLPGDPTAHDWVRADHVSPLMGMERAMDLLGQPLSNAQQYLDLLVLEAAARRGVRALLTGYGSEEIQWTRFTFVLERLAADGRWRDLASQLWAHARRTGLGLAATVWRHLLKPRVPEPFRLARRRLRGHAMPGGIVLYRREAVRRLDLEARAEARYRTPRTSAEDFADGFLGDALPFSHELGGALAAPHAIGILRPFLDRRLLDFCARIPEPERARDGWDRLPLRRCMAGLLPDALRWGRKSSLGPVLVHALLRHERPRMAEVFGEGIEVLAPWVHLEVLRGHYRRLLAARPGAAPLTGAEIVPVWQAMSLVLWLRHTGLRP